jgi:hypothetical protein
LSSADEDRVNKVQLVIFDGVDAEKKGLHCNGRKGNRTGRKCVVKRGNSSQEKKARVNEFVQNKIKFVRQRGMK